MEEKKPAPNDVVLNVSGADDSSTCMLSPQPSRTGSPQKSFQDSNFELMELRPGSASPEVTATTSGKPPRSPCVIRRVSLARSAFSKPKSRFEEPIYTNEIKVTEETPQRKSSAKSPNVGSPSHRATATTPRSVPITPRTSLIGTAARGEEDEDDDEEVYRTANIKVHEKSGKKIKKLVVLEWTLFVFITGFLIACLTIDKLESKSFWSLELWKWCVLVLVVLCGRLVTEWLINILVFVIETNYLLKKKVLYFVYGLKRSVQVFIWLGLILLAWFLLFDHGVMRSKQTDKILGYVTRGLASCEIGAAIWMLKNLLVKLLATSFQSTRFFDRIKEAIFHQYVLRSLSRPPLVEIAQRKFGKAPSSGQLSFKNLPKAKNDGKEGPKEEVIDVEKLSKMKQDKISAWTMKGLVNVISGSGLSTLSHSLDDMDDEESEQKDIEITSEYEALAAAYEIFLNVAKRNSKYIEEDDLCRFLKKEEVELVFPLFEGAVETRKIRKKQLKNWLVYVYNERKALAHSLTDTKTAIEELNRLGSGVVLSLILIVWLLLMGFLTTNILVFISSQLLLVAFVFGNTAKTVFEAIIFVFVMHPFDVGDRCVVDGQQLIVEEMNILTTIFMKPDNEKVYYPNSVLSTKPISNFYRSPEQGDAVEFAVDVSTTIDTIAKMKDKIKTYLESKPQHWRPGHSVAVKEIEDVNKMTMALYISHTINFQNYGDKTTRRTDLILELKRIFEELNIKYHLLPQEIYLTTRVRSATTDLPPSWR